MKKKIELPNDGLTVDKLIQGQPYTYLKGKNADEKIKVLYQRTVNLPNNKRAYNFRLTGYSGFTNLTEEEVLQRIFPYIP